MDKAGQTGSGRMALMPTPIFLYVATAAIIVGILSVAAMAMRADRQTAWDRAVQTTTSLRGAITSDVDQTISQFNLTILGTMRALATPGVSYLPPELRQRMLFGPVADARYAGGVAVLDAEGDITYHSRDLETPPGNFATRDYFSAQRDNAGLGLYISTPFEPRIGPKVLTVALSRRLVGPDGAFAGIVVGFLRLDYFEEKLKSLNLAPSDAVVILRNDGAVIIREPAPPGFLETNVRASALFSQFMREPSGTIVGQSNFTGEERLISFTRVGELPLIVSVSISVAEVLKPWREKTFLFGTLTVVLCGGLGILALLFNRELHRRTELEDRLNALVDTDPLTGLQNRRSFDRVIDVEWRSARRAGTPLSVLFVDGDAFKAFNDLYGHHVGDRVLRTIAETISANIRRPRDLACRFGGEEFTVILPETKIDGAIQVAEGVRQAIAELRVPRSDSPPGAVTVSIGAACGDPRQGDSVADILQAADAALYRAKSGGRNRVEAHSGPLGEAFVWAPRLSGDKPADPRI